MSGHVREALLRAREDELAPAEADLVAYHVSACPPCAAYDLELRQTERLLQRRSHMSLPPFRSPMPVALSTFGWTLRVAVATLAIVAIALPLGLALQRAREGLAGPTDAPSGAVLATGKPSGSSMLVFLDHISTSLILVDTAGAEVGRVKLGEGVATLPSVHVQGGQLALWRSPGRERQIPADLVIWDGKNTRTLATVSDLAPWSVPVWSTDGRSLVFALASPPSETGPNAPPRSGRLVRVDVSTGAQQVLRTFDRELPVVPLVVRGDIVVGLQLPYEGNGRYLTFDLRTGTQLSAAARAEPYLMSSFSVDSEGRVVAGRSQRFESPGPVTLITWPADDYARRTRILEMPTMTSALHWPGRREILVSGARTIGGQYEALAISEDGSVRSLLRSGQPLEIAAASPDGTSILMDEGIDHRLVMYSLADAGLGLPGRAIARPASGIGLPGADFLGWISVR